MQFSDSDGDGNDTTKARLNDFLQECKRKTWELKRGKFTLQNGTSKNKSFRWTRHRAGKLIAEPPIWLTSSGENSEKPQRGGERGGGGGIHHCLNVRKLSVFSFKASLCTDVREGGLLYTGYFKAWLQISLWCVGVRIHWIRMSRKVSSSPSNKSITFSE